MARAARGLRLLHVISSLNRGMRALSGAMGRRGFGYAVLVTFVVVFAGGAGMFAFENDNADGRGRNDYPTALWWTAMIVTTISSDYWPHARRSKSSGGSAARTCRPAHRDSSVAERKP